MKIVDEQVEERRRRAIVEQVKSSPLIHGKRNDLTVNG